MQQPAAPFTWTSPRERAAAFVAEDLLTDEEIAAKLSIHRVTLARWKAHPEFQARVDVMVADLARRAQRYAIARVERRVQAQNERWEKMRQVIADRATDADMRDVAGGPTGLLVRTYKTVGRGEDFQVLPEFAVDAGLLREMRELELQVARELGQLVERQAIEHSGELRRGHEVDDDSAEYVAELIARGLNGTAASSH